MPVREDMVRALQLQQRRCEVYHIWDEQFLRVTAGTISSEELMSTMQNVVVSEFQRVSSELRALQQTVLLAKEASAKGTATFTAYTVLHEWIDRVQKAESQHYLTAVEMYSVLAAHTAGNTPLPDPPEYQHADSKPATATTVAAPSSAQTAEQGGTQGGEHREATSSASPNASERVKESTTGEAGKPAADSARRPARSGNEEKCPATASASSDKTAVKDATPDAPLHTKGGTVSSSDASPSGASGAAGTPTANGTTQSHRGDVSLHDMSRCVLNHLLPPHARGLVSFVHCEDALDDLAMESERADDPQGTQPRPQADEPAHSTVAHAGTEQSQPLQVMAPLSEEMEWAEVLVRQPGRRIRVRVPYNAVTVALRCARWSSVALPLRDRRRRLQAEVAELTEELQCELSDLEE